MTLARRRSEAGPIDPTTGPSSLAQDIPALVCAGSDDPWSNRAVTDQILAHPKHSELLMMDGVGHLPNLEAEHEFNEALRDFLRYLRVG